MNQPPRAARPRFGFFNALCAFGLWGVLPIYWKQLKVISALELLAHRAAWSFVFLWLLIFATRRTREVMALLRNRRSFWMLALSTGLLTSNWGIYIWAVNAAHIVETGLGYFLNPLANIALGTLLLHERLSGVQRLAVLVAASGVAYLAWKIHGVPWISLSLALTFAFYGLIRKLSRVDAIPGLCVETTLVLPLSAGFLAWMYWKGQGHWFTLDTRQKILLAGAGVATAMPVIFFVNAAHHLTLTALGFMQYLAPSLQLSIGVFLYGEQVTPSMRVAFVCVWAALALVSLESVLRKKSNDR